MVPSSSNTYLVRSCLKIFSEESWRENEYRGEERWGVRDWGRGNFIINERIIITKI